MHLPTGRMTFDIDGELWRVRLRSPLSGRHDYHTLMRVEIDGQTVATRTFDGALAELFRPQDIHFTRGGEAYRVAVGPISAWRYGAQVFRNGVHLHTYRNRAFARLPRWERFARWVDGWESKDQSISGPDMPFWKTALNGAIFGVLLGVAVYGTLAVMRLQGMDVSDPPRWAMYAAIFAFVMVWPRRWAFVR